MVTVSQSPSPTTDSLFFSSEMITSKKVIKLFSILLCIFIQHVSTRNSQNIESESEETGEILRKALINHTLTHGGEEDLDKIIFSSIPEGSKLILQSVSVVETDEDGNQVPGAAHPIHYNVKLTNATDLEESDLIVAGSADKYEITGTQLREKGKTNTQHHGNDYGKTKKVTLTDTDGEKITNYKGVEDGVKDYANEKGKAVSNEGERYRDTKKKNKGRRVSGFKRTYHKEEFQRTEHFYDDEDLKKIAESYGLKDAKEQSKHGTKDDDRKYHGTKTESTDGKKIKKENGSTHAFNKGGEKKYKDKESVSQKTVYEKSHGSPSKHNYYHPSHNYDGSHSNSNSNSNPSAAAASSVHDVNKSYFMNFKPGYVQTNFKPIFSATPLINYSIEPVVGAATASLRYGRRYHPPGSDVHQYVDLIDTRRPTSGPLFLGRTRTRLAAPESRRPTTFLNKKIVEKRMNARINTTNNRIDQRTLYNERPPPFMNSLMDSVANFFTLG